jgi:hypothetical protein
MCEILNKSKETEFVGYKMVWRHKKTGAFHSSFTGQRYHKGYLPKTETANPLSDAWRILRLTESFFENKMVGRTFAFESKEHAIDMSGDKCPDYIQREMWECVICKVKISHGIYDAYYSYFQKKGAIGRKIEFLKVVKIMG